MKATDLRRRYAAETTGEMPFETNYAKWLETKLIIRESKTLKQQHPIDENRIEGLWNKSTVEVSGIDRVHYVMTYRSFKAALKELSTPPQPEEKVKGHTVTEEEIKLVLSTTLQTYGNNNTSWISSGSLDQAAKAIASLYREEEGM